MTQLTNEDWDVALLALVLWREARSETVDTKRCVAWTIRNRALKPSWWGSGWVGVIMQPWQYSSMTAPGDPNLIKYPAANDSSWLACMDVASEVYTGGLDVSHGASHYFDKSLDDGKEPSWAKDGSMAWVMDSGAFHFWKKA
jgi:N-acetylmuramoyl-L-alanine amidase